MKPVSVTWIPHPEPLVPLAVAAWGETVLALRHRLQHLPKRHLSELRVSHFSDVTVVLGPPPFLPWVDGVTYLGTALEAPALLLPTHLKPSVSPQLLHRALQKK